MTKNARQTILRRRDYRALAEFRRALRRFLAFSEAAAAGAGLTAAQHQALLAIKGMPGPVSIGDLAAWLGVRHHSAVGLVGRLIRLGLVSKRADPADRRRMSLTLTARAERRLKALSDAHRGELSRLSAVLQSLLTALR
jgi:DNA-binding MarR family transcriptional regulator